MNNVAFRSLMTAFLIAAVPTAAFAEGGATAGGGAGLGLLPIGVGLVMGIAVLGGALAQGKAVSAALESIGRNPGASGKLLVPMLLGLALIESLVIFAFLISRQLLAAA